MNKKISIFLVVIMLVGILSQVSFAQSEVYVKNKIVEDSKNVNVSIPVITGMKNKNIEKEINKDIEDTINSIIANFKKDNKDEKKAELEIDYDVKSKKEILSIVVEVEVDSPKNADTFESRYYYNIDIKSEKEISLSDLFPNDKNYKDKVNTRIKEEIKINKSEYYVGIDEFKSIEDEQNFYVNDSADIIVEFEKGEIAPASEGYISFNVGNIRVNQNVYTNYKYGYNFKLPPVWDRKVEIKEEGNITKFIYIPEDDDFKSQEIFRITTIDKTDYKIDNKDYVIGQNGKYVYLTKVFNTEIYKTDKEEEARYQKVVRALDGIDDLFTLNDSLGPLDNKILINGKDVYLEASIIDGNIPVAEVLRGLDYNVTWENSTREVTVKKAETRSIIGTRENKYTINNEEVKLDQGAFIVDGITYVPQDYFTKVLKIDVEL